MGTSLRASSCNRLKFRGRFAFFLYQLLALQCHARLKKPVHRRLVERITFVMAEERKPACVSSNWAEVTYYP